MNGQTAVVVLQLGELRVGLWGLEPCCKSGYELLTFKSDSTMVTVVLRESRQSFISLRLSEQSPNSPLPSRAAACIANLDSFSIFALLKKEIS